MTDPRVAAVAQQAWIRTGRKLPPAHEAEMVEFFKEHPDITAQEVMVQVGRDEKPYSTTFWPFLKKRLEALGGQAEDVTEWQRSDEIGRRWAERYYKDPGPAELRLQAKMVEMGLPIPGERE